MLLLRGLLHCLPLTFEVLKSQGPLHQNLRELPAGFFKMLDGMGWNTKEIEGLCRDPVRLIFNELARIVMIRDPGRFVGVYRNMIPIFLPGKLSEAINHVDILSPKERSCVTR